MTDQSYMQKMRLNPYQRQRTSKICTAEDHWKMLKAEDRRAWLRKMLSRMGRLDLLSVATGQPTGKPVYARVEANRWIADCECRGAEVVTPADPAFFCLSCLNEGNRNRPRPVIFPDDKEDVEDALLARPEPETRNYTPADAVFANPGLGLRGFYPEDIESLRAENREHGLPHSRSERGRGR